MTVRDMLNEKYMVLLKNMNRTTYQNFKTDSEATGKHLAELMYKSLTITANDIRKNGGWNSELYQEIDRMHKSKLLASNKHRQYSGHVTTYWLTEKGWKYINKNNAIC